jgi:hypothetical protein
MIFWWWSKRLQQKNIIPFSQITAGHPVNMTGVPVNQLLLKSSDWRILLSGKECKPKVKMPVGTSRVADTTSSKRCGRRIDERGSRRRHTLQPTSLVKVFCHPVESSPCVLSRTWGPHMVDLLCARHAPLSYIGQVTCSNFFYVWAYPCPLSIRPDTYVYFFY